MQRCRPGALALGSLLAVLAVLSSACAGDRPRVVAHEPSIGMPVASAVAESDDAALVDACVQWVPIAAFSGDAAMAALWDAANQDIAVLADHCRALTTNRRLVLRQMADALHASPAAGNPVSVDGEGDGDGDGDSICAVIPASGETICVDT